MSTLYLIPTPIYMGGLPDLPEKTLQITRALDCFIVERGKTARAFLKSIGPHKALQEMEYSELHENDLKTAEHFFREKVKEGKDIGLLSEAGCPGVADPGATIVQMAHERNVKVVPLVGPSSILLALMASGMNGQSFCFHGYLSAKRNELGKDLKRLEQLAARLRQTQIFMDAPYRSNQVVETVMKTLNPRTKFGIASEISSPEAFVRTLSIKDWKGLQLPDLHKKNTIFMIFV